MEVKEKFEERFFSKPLFLTALSISTHELARVEVVFYLKKKKNLKCATHFHEEAPMNHITRYLSKTSKAIIQPD